MSAVLLVTCSLCGGEVGRFPADPGVTDTGEWWRLVGSRYHWCPKCSTGDDLECSNRPPSIEGEWDD